MGKYLKVFDLTSEYQTYVNGPDVILPNVSKCKDDNTKVYYNPYVEPVDPYNGHEYVEIGGLKWATMNVGANSITDYGLYFQWGDTRGYTADQVTGGSAYCKDFIWGDYMYSNYDGSVMIKYNANDGLSTLTSVDDAVQATWGGTWRMPTEAEFQTLLDATTNTWVKNYQGSGINGRLFTDKIDSSKVLFFPAAGTCRDDGINGVGSGGNYWSSSLDTSRVYCGRFLQFGSGNICEMYMRNRCIGKVVRGVAD